MRQGDLFEPVRGERFDLIVSQPPYYPGAGEVFLHGGAGGWEIADRIIADAPKYLAADGVAVVHTSLPLGRETPAGVVEYTPGAGEVAGTRHSLIIVRRQPPLTRKIYVSPVRTSDRSPQDLQPHWAVKAIVLCTSSYIRCER